MTHKIDIKLYPKLPTLSVFISNQYDEDPDNIYVSNDITDDNLHALNTADINPTNIKVLLDVCDYLEINHYYIWNNAKGEFNHDPDFVPFLYEFNVITLTSPNMCNEYFLEKYRDNLELIIIVSCFVSNLDIIHYYISKGCLSEEMNPETLQETRFNTMYEELIRPYAPSTRWEVIIPFLSAVKNHDVSVLIQLKQWGCKITSLIFRQSMTHDTTVWTKYCHENGCELSDELISMSLGSDTLDNLIYLHTHGCNWNEIDINRGLSSNKNEHVIYMLENGCPYEISDRFYVSISTKDKRIFKEIYKRENETNVLVPLSAAHYGNYELLSYIITLGEPFTDLMMELTVSAGDNLECMILGIQQGCEINESILRLINEETRPKCYSYLKEHGFELPIHG